MTSYVILANPGHNRIYFDAAISMARQELSAIAWKFGIPLHVEEDRTVEGLPTHLCFSTEKPLEGAALQAIGASSLYYALFERTDGELLRPVRMPEFRCFDESMNSILHYTGKTNEQFTRLMVNLAVAACRTNRPKLNLLDPMCGKGTTLYEGLIRGMDVTGVEINAHWFSEMSNYIVKYLQMGRYKHTTEKGKRSLHGKKLAEQFKVVTAPTKEAFAADQTCTFEIFHGDTRLCDTLLRKNSMDLLVSDLPYGVQHASKATAGGTQQLSRSPYALLKESLPAWRTVLRPGGALVLSFNEHTLHYDGTADLLERSGFEVLREPPFSGYQHRVDQSILRDLIVAVAKPR